MQFSFAKADLDRTVTVLKSLGYTQVENSQHQFEHSRWKKKPSIVVVYASGAIVFQGKEISQARNSFAKVYNA